MKKLWNKFRKWLIKKLGGYVAGPVKVVNVHHAYPVKLYATQQHIPKDRYENDAEFKYSVDRGLCMMFIEEILEHHRDVIHIDTCECVDLDRPFPTLTIRAHMDVVPDLEGK